MQQETEVIRETPAPLPLCPPNPTWAGLIEPGPPWWEGSKPWHRPL